MDETHDIDQTDPAPAKPKRATRRRRLGIDEAIPAIIGELPSIGKESSSPELSYAFRGIDDILPHVKPLLAKYSVYIRPSYRVLSDTEVTTRHGAKMTRVVVEGTFTFTAFDGSSRDAVTIGEARDTSDKAANKAMTAAHKYAVIQMFNIAGQDDPDFHRPGDERDSRRAVPHVRMMSNFDKLHHLGPALTTLGVGDAVKEFAASNGIDLRYNHDTDENVGVVLRYAEQLIDEVHRAEIHTQEFAEQVVQGEAGEDDDAEDVDEDVEEPF